MTSTEAQAQMGDIVNDHFKQFYPADRDTNCEPRWCVNVGGREYQGETSTIFPKMVCADGFAMSVQGHFGAYSHPRDDFAHEYKSVEILCPADPILDEHGGHECGDEKIYGYVPIKTVEAVIASHGGLMARSHKDTPHD